MAYYGEYDSCQESNERIYEYPPNSGYAQQRPLARPPCQSATQGGRHHGEYDSCQESNGRIYESPPNSGYAQQRPLARPPCQSATQGGYGFNEYGGRTDCNKFNAGGGCNMSGHQIIPQGQIVRVCAKANPDYALGIRDGRAIMLFYNPNDPTLQWVKDESWSNRVRDQVGHPAFALVNKATGQALRHAPAECQEVLLTQYEGDYTYDESILWSESEDMGYGYRTVRMANNVGLNLDAFQGDSWNGGTRDGTHVVLWKWNKQDNQLWKLSPCY